MTPPPREHSIAELAEDIEALGKGLNEARVDIKAQGAEILKRIDELPFLRTDVYEARHAALRAEVDLRMTQIIADLAAVKRAAAEDAAEAKADAANSRQIGLWAIGLIAAALIGAIVIFAIGGGPGP